MGMPQQQPCPSPAARCTPCDPAIAAFRDATKGRTIAAALMHGLFVMQPAAPAGRVLSLGGCESALNPPLLRKLERQMPSGTQTIVGNHCVPPTGDANGRRPSYDVVVGDLGHINSTQAFDALWPRAVSPGGAYVLESASFGQRRSSRRGPAPFALMEDIWSERLGAWTDSLLAHTSGGSDSNEATSAPSARWANAHVRGGNAYVRGNAEALARARLHPLPASAALVGCGVAACVAIKHSPASRVLDDPYAAARAAAGRDPSKLNTHKNASLVGTRPPHAASSVSAPLSAAAPAPGTCTTASATVPWMRRLLFGSEPVSDKSKHYYEVMYGLFAAPLARAARRWRRPVRLFEIGLGCNQMLKNGNKSASVELWRRLLPPGAAIFEADFKQDCVDKINRERLLGSGVLALHGDQSDDTTLRRWVRETGGDFDVVVDDGSHVNRHILLTFRALWPHVRAGGLYFMEDLHVGRRKSYDQTGGHGVVSEVLQAWQHQLLTGERFDAAWAGVRALPDAAAFVGCSHRICVVMKDAHT